ncbi:peptidase M28 [Sphingomonas oleivorans]|uniref:Peptidase M28 n=2 Tax=Sphingomonas oleivorans TaxID=1735121 RepID=A0A2T5FWJ1_9SPHN|nr:peptidase M28 [Sphingomonas oleivorans]
MGKIALAIACLAGAADAEPPISEASLMRHIATLAGDAMEGRRPGTAGGERAVAYIVEQMQAIGLQPGAKDGGWLQPVKLVERRPVSTGMTASLGGTTVVLDPGDLILIGREAETRIASAPLIFAGFATGAALDGVDLKGAIVLLLAGKPQGAGEVPNMAERRAELVRRGAAGLIVPMAAGLPWAEVRRQYEAGRIVSAEAPEPGLQGAISHFGWSRIATAAGSEAMKLVAEAGTADFRARPIGHVAIDVRTEVHGFESHNVIGRLAGTTRPDEAILYLAHWDHLGLCRPAGTKDRICNGAVDNASGVALMLETARLLAQAPRPGRSLMFMATTAEESGLLGARAFVRDPPVPLGSIRAAINFDTVAVAPRGRAIATIGRGMTPLDPLVDAAARAVGRTSDTRTVQNMLVERQDGWALIQAGVPAIMPGSAFADMERLNRFLAGDYHGPGDEAGKGIELGGAAEDGAFFVMLGRLLADPERFPTVSR